MPEMNGAPCLKCGAESNRVVEFAGLMEAEVFMCDECFEPAMADLQEKRGQFAELIAAGVPRDKANEIMIARIDGAQQQ